MTGVKAVTTGVAGRTDAAEEDREDGEGEARGEADAGREDELE